MQHVRLGHTDLEVSRVALGTWAFGGEWGTFDPKDAEDTIRKALEFGVNFFDTATPCIAAGTLPNVLASR